ncbi:head-tail adaptor protein [uncultured Butyricimonas sp.]|jgi:head-tail adaptor|uniref:phage head completion protein n=1 Tax=uncultured Butyricimonas sp. TaxID=1268785 RepID=UPI0026DBECFF|nr:head-tail adaptor protein [uncultured Butyricimonas sp.]
MGAINCGEFTEMVTFKRLERTRTGTGAVDKKYVEAGKAYVKMEYKTIGEGADDTKIALASVIELTTYILAGVDNTYRVVVKGKEYEILSVVEVKRRYMIITAKLL